MNEPVHFREVQEFPRWPILLPTLLVLGAFALAAMSGRLQESPGALIVFAVVILLISLFTGFLLRLRLVTEVRSDGIHVRLWPFTQRRIAPGEIAAVWACTYRPLLEYGGWGIRYGWRGMAYNARGNRGVQLVLDSGKRLLLGSQQPEELDAAIRQVAPTARSSEPGDRGSLG